MTAQEEERTPLLPNESDQSPGHALFLLSPAKKRIITYGICLLAAFLSSLDLTLVATCLQPISSELKASNHASWIATTYLWSTTSWTPLYGRLADQLTRRVAFLQALALFGIGTALCGLSHSLPVLAFARFVAGCGGGGIGAVSAVITSDMYELKDRGFYQGIFFFGFAGGLGVGGPLGGWIANNFGWRMAFLAQLPIILVVFLLAWHTIPKTRSTHASARKILSKIDFGGSLSLLLAIGCLLFALGFVVEQNHSLSYPPFVATAIGFILFVALFIFAELRVASEPVLPLELLKQRDLLCVGIITGLIAVVNFSFVYFLPQFFELVLGRDAAEAGAHLIPNAIAMCIGSPLVGILMRVTGRFKWLTTFCSLGPVTSMLLLSSLNRNSPDALLWLAVVPMGLGFSGLVTSSLIAAMSAVAQTQVAPVTGFVFTFRSIGQVLGVSISSSIYQGSLTVELRKRFTSEKLISQLRHVSGTLQDLPEDAQVLARAAFRIAIRNVFYFTSVCAIIVFLASLPLRNRSLKEPAEVAKAPAEADTPTDV